MTDRNAERVADINACVARALIRAAGMIAENMRRNQQGEAMAYSEADFFGLIDEENIDPTTVRALLCYWR